MRDHLETVDAHARRHGEVRRMFGAIAHRYDLLNHLLSFRRDVAWRRAAVRLAGVRPGARVLDVCSGTGDLALAFNAKMTGKGRVVAIDISPEMLELGRRKFRAGKDNGVAAERSDGVTFAVADTLALPVADGLFDVVSVAFGIRNLEDVDRGLSEIARVLKPGGQVVVLEFARPRSPLIRGLYEIYLHALLPVIGRIVSGSRIDAYRYLADTISRFPEPERFAGMMRAVGFREVKIHSLTCGIVNVHRGVK